MASIFSKIIAKEMTGYIVAENENFIAFLDIFPLVEGHTLVVPKKEIDYIFDIEDQLLQEMIVFAKEVGLKIEKVISCERIGISVIGLEVPHAHIHLVPINSADDLNFTRPKLKIAPERMNEIAEQIKSA